MYLHAGDEGVEKGKRLKILTSNELLSRLPVLLAPIKAGNNSYKLRKKIRKTTHLLHQHKIYQKSL